MAASHIFQTDPNKRFGDFVDSSGKAAQVQLTSSGAIPVDTELTVSGNVIVDKVKVTGNTQADGKGTDYSMVVDTSGHLQVDLASTATVDTELPAAAALTDDAATPTAPAVGAFLMAYDGSKWDMVRGTSTAGLTVDCNGTKIDANGSKVDCNGSTVKSPTAGDFNVTVADGVKIDCNNTKVDCNGSSVVVSGTVTVSDGVKIDCNSTKVTLVDDGKVLVNNAAGSGAYVQPGTSTTWTVDCNGSTVKSPTAGDFNVTVADGVKIDANSSKVDCNGTKIDCNSSKVDCNGTKVDCNSSKVDCNLSGVKDGGPMWTSVTKYYTSTGAATDGVIWSPTAGKKWAITDIIISISAAATVTLEDDLYAGDSPFMKLDLAANGGIAHHFRTPIVSGENDADLIVTTSAGNVYITVVGYEV